MTPTRLMLAATAVTAYASAIIAANVVTAQFGLVPVWPGVAATAGTYAAGAALLARDAVQDTAGRVAVLVVIVAGAAVSAWLATPQLALASAVAFTVAELADMAVYTPLRTRGWGRAALASGVAGAVIDSLLFLAIAGFPLTLITGQLIGKILWATILPIAVVTAARAVLHHRRPAWNS